MRTKKLKSLEKQAKEIAARKFGTFKAAN